MNKRLFGVMVLIGISTALAEFPSVVNYIWILLLFVAGAQVFAWSLRVPDSVAHVVLEGGRLTFIVETMRDPLSVLGHLVSAAVWYVTGSSLPPVFWLVAFGFSVLFGRLVWWWQCGRHEA